MQVTHLKSHGCSSFFITHCFDGPCKERVYMYMSNVCMCYSLVIYVEMILISNYMGGTTSFFFFERKGATDCGHI